jgi:hypothetical protein
MKWCWILSKAFSASVLAVFRMKSMTFTCSPSCGLRWHLQSHPVPKPFLHYGEVTVAFLFILHAKFIPTTELLPWLLPLFAFVIHSYLSTVFRSQYRGLFPWGFLQPFSLSWVLYHIPTFYSTVACSLAGMFWNHWFV